MSEPIDLCAELMRLQPPATQQEACAFAVRRCLATLGRLPEGQERRMCAALARGLFGLSWMEADDDQQEAWTDMMEAEYRKAIAH